MRNINHWPSVTEGLPARRYGDSRCPLLVSPLPPPYWPYPPILRRLCRKTERTSTELPCWRFWIFAPRVEHSNRFKHAHTHGKTFLYCRAVGFLFVLQPVRWWSSVSLIVLINLKRLELNWRPRWPCWKPDPSDRGETDMFASVQYLNSLCLLERRNTSCRGPFIRQLHVGGCQSILYTTPPLSGHASNTEKLLT